MTVRRTGLLAVSRLLRELPNQTAVTELWVRAALPMVSHVALPDYAIILTRLCHDPTLNAKLAAGICTVSRHALCQWAVSFLCIMRLTQTCQQHWTAPLEKLSVVTCNDFVLLDTVTLTSIELRI